MNIPSLPSYLIVGLLLPILGKIVWDFIRDLKNGGQTATLLKVAIEELKTDISTMTTTIDSFKNKVEEDYVRKEVLELYKKDVERLDASLTRAWAKIDEAVKELSELKGKSDK